MNLLTMEHVTKSYTDRILLNDVGFGINENEKIGVIGINGMGKSTLLKVAAQIEPYDSGKISMGNHVKICYLPQTPVFAEGTTILRAAVEGNTDEMNRWTIEAEAKSMLNQLGFTDYNEKIEHMSGGQKKRVALVQALLTPADILILDEPTNHLDILSKEILEEALNNYTGTVLYVSHDRYFINKTATRILELTNQNMVNYIGNYDYYLEKREELTQIYAPGLEIENTEQKESATKLDWKQQKEEQARLRKRENDLKKTEAEIEKLETRDKEIDEEMSDPRVAVNVAECVKLSNEKAEIAQQLEELYEKWEELA